MLDKIITALISHCDMCGHMLQQKPLIQTPKKKKNDVSYVVTSLKEIIMTTE